VSVAVVTAPPERANTTEDSDPGSAFSPVGTYAMVSPFHGVMSKVVASVGPSAPRSRPPASVTVSVPKYALV
jgi:hypothetical protein